MSGPTGLDYAVLPAVLDIYEIKPEDRRDLFKALRVMEGAALGVMNKKP